MATFNINGDTYEIPGVDTFTMGEAVIFDSYSDVTLDKVGELDGLHSGVFAAQAHIAVARKYPNLNAREIRATIERLNLLELLESVVADEEEAESPPAEPPPSEPDSSGDSNEKNERSGEGSSATSDDPPVTHLRATGTQG